MSNKTGFWVTLSPRERDSPTYTRLPPQMRDPVNCSRSRSSCCCWCWGGPPPIASVGQLRTPRRVDQHLDGLIVRRDHCRLSSRALGYAAVYAYVAPWHLPATSWYTWVIALVGVDLLFYTYHRIAHRVRLIWSHHQAHHSSECFNFATAAAGVEQQRRDPDVAAVAIAGVPPWMVFFGFSVNPDLPILGAHQAHRKARTTCRIHLQHAVAPPRPSAWIRNTSTELRRHPDHLGPDVRHLPGRLFRPRCGLTNR